MREYIKLCDVCDFQGGSQPPKDEWSFDLKDGYIRMLQIRDFTQSERVAPEYIKITKATKICEVDDILIARYGASLGKILTGLAGAYNVAIMKTIPDTNVLEKKYLYYYLKSPIFQGFLLNVGSRAAQAGFNKNDLQDLLIPNITRNEQVEIVGILERVETVIEARQKELQKLDDLIKARFVEMFGDPVINSMRWPEVLIGDNCFVTKLAGFEYTQYINYEDSGDVVMVKAQNVKNGKLNRKELSFISKKVSDSLPRSQLEPGDVVMTYVGANIGDVAVIDNEYKYHLAPNVAKIRPDAEVYDSIYFAYMLLFLNSYIVKNSADTAKAALGMDRIRKLHVFIPPIDIQRKFSEFIKQIDKSKFRDFVPHK